MHKDEAPKTSEPSPKVLEALRLSRLLYEKCELGESKEAFLRALKLARKAEDLRSTMEAITGLLRLAGEALDQQAIQQWDEELDRLMRLHPDHIPPMAWYCKGAIASGRQDPKRAQVEFHTFLRMVRADKTLEGSRKLLDRDDLMARGWFALALCLMERKKMKSARALAQRVLQLYEARNLRGINGVLYLLLGAITEREQDLDGALRWYQKAHATFLGEHNWYYYLHVLKAYARVARMQRNYAQAYWYLDLMDKAASGPEFESLKKDVAVERRKLEEDAVDLLIDSQKGMIKTRESGSISLRKQYVLLNILEALYNAYQSRGTEGERGLSKAEIIERVWNEPYRPEAHDNKLYYNINRLRKLIEPDMRKPQYLLNWREGYRLAPGLRVHKLGESVSPEVHYDDRGTRGA